MEVGLQSSLQLWPNRASFRKYKRAPRIVDVNARQNLTENSPLANFIDFRAKSHPPYCPLLTKIFATIQTSKLNNYKTKKKRKKNEWTKMKLNKLSPVNKYRSGNDVGSGCSLTQSAKLIFQVLR